MKFNRFTFLASAIALIVSISPSVTQLGKTNTDLVDNNKIVENSRIENVPIDKGFEDKFNKFEKIETRRSGFGWLFSHFIPWIIENIVPIIVGIVILGVIGSIINAISGS